MAHTEAVLSWIRKYGIRSIIDAPCASQAAKETFIAVGIEEYDGVDIQDSGTIKADLTVFFPARRYDALYINCVFCTGLHADSVGDHAILARNYASWPVKYIILYDTRVFDWGPYFAQSGWRLLESVPSVPSNSGKNETVSEIWGR